MQISAGYMHSGYPIMIPIDTSIKIGLDEHRLRREGAWGLLHELGHNHQEAEWTFDGTGEVTNNLIVLYIYDKVLGHRFDSGHEAIRNRGERDKRIRDLMARGAPFAVWRDDPFLALMMYIQLYEAFGPKPFHDVFADYSACRMPSVRSRTTPGATSGWYGSRRPSARTSVRSSRRGVSRPATGPGPRSKICPAGCRTGSLPEVERRLCRTVTEHSVSVGPRRS